MRANAEEVRFREVEAILDRELAARRVELESSGVVIRDHSNRSGGRGEYPQWAYDFDVERRSGNLVELVRVDVTYNMGSPDMITLRRTSERFWILGSSMGKRSKTEELPSANILTLDLFSIVLREIELGEADLRSQPAG